MRISDWSSDVCSSDLNPQDRHEEGQVVGSHAIYLSRLGAGAFGLPPLRCLRSESRVADSPPVSFLWGFGGVFSMRRRISSSRLSSSDRQSVVSGKSVSVRVDLGGRGIIKKKK